MDIRKTIQDELLKSTTGIRAMARETGIEPATICRAKQGRTIEVVTADKLLDYFGYRITKGKRAGK